MGPAESRGWDLRTYSPMVEYCMSCSDYLGGSSTVKSSPSLPLNELFGPGHSDARGADSFGKCECEHDCTSGRRGVTAAVLFGSRSGSWGWSSPAAGYGRPSWQPSPVCCACPRPLAVPYTSTFGRMDIAGIEAHSLLFRVEKERRK